MESGPQYYSLHNFNEQDQKYILINALQQIFWLPR